MTADPEILKRGAALAQEGRFEEARAVFESLLQSDPRDVEALFMQGACFYKEGRHSEAADCWNRVLAVDPEHAKAKGMLAKLPAPGFDSGFGAPPAAAPPAAEKTATKASAKKAKPKKPILKYVVILAVLGVLGAFGADMYLNPNSYPFLRKETARLEWKWTPGEILVYRGGMDQTTRIGPPEGGGGGMPFPEMTIGQKMSFDLRLTVRQVDANGTAALDASYDKIGIQMVLPEMPGMGAAGAEIGALLNQAFGEAAGKTYQLEVDRHGKFLRCEGMNPIAESVLAAMGTANPFNSAGGSPTELLGDEATRKSHQLMFGELPNSPASVGGSWVGSLNGQSVPALQGSIQNLKFSFEGAEVVAGEECARIVQTLAFSMDGGPDLSQLGLGDGVEFEPRSSEGTGVFHFSTQAGRLVKSDATILSGVVLKMNLPAMSGVEGGGMSMNLDIRTDSRLELVSTGSVTSTVVEAVPQSSSPAQPAAAGGGATTSLEEGLSGKWFFLFEGDPATFTFYPNGTLGVVINREGGVTFNLNGSYTIDGDSIQFDVETPQGPAQVTAYNAKIAGPNFTFNYDGPDGPEIRAERR